MKIVTKKEAMEVLTGSLFKPVNGKTLSVFPLCTGKYAWNGSQADYVGKDINVSSSVHAVFVERRQDKHGPYAKLMCVMEDI